MQFYNGVGTDVKVPGLGGKRYGKNAGFCLEDQMYPGAVHNPHFPSIICARTAPITCARSKSTDERTQRRRAASCDAAMPDKEREPVGMVPAPFQGQREENVTALSGFAASSLRAGD